MKEEPAMPQNNSAGRHLFLALIWTAAAVFMAVGIIVNLPGVAPLPALLLGLSGATPGRLTMMPTAMNTAAAVQIRARKRWRPAELF